MKRVVMSGDLTQRAMRPADLQDGYIARAQADIARFELLAHGRDRQCPACDGGGAVEFERLGFPYRRCTRCQSLFVSPLPDADRLARFHSEGEAEKFRAEQLLPLTAEVRARYAMSPRVHWVLATATAHVGSSLTFKQFGAESPRLTQLLASAGALLPWDSDSAKRAVDGVIAFDVLERAVDFPLALRQCRTALRPGGLLFVTTISGEGFEIRMLGSRTRSLVPPLHLQLLSRAGWVAALAREDLTVEEYSTPGELDVQAVAEMCLNDPMMRLPPILDEIIRHEDEQIGRAFQDLLQQAGLSAHVQFVAKAGARQGFV